MKKIIVLLSLFTLTLSVNATPIHHAKHIAPKQVTYVYICDGKYSKRYHSSPTCRGLDNCKGGVEKVTLEQAIKMGRTPCHVCE